MMFPLYKLQFDLSIVKIDEIAEFKRQNRI
jgi:hypothetical protein